MPFTTMQSPQINDDEASSSSLSSMVDHTSRTMSSMLHQALGDRDVHYQYLLDLSPTNESSSSSSSSSSTSKEEEYIRNNNKTKAQQDPTASWHTTTNHNLDTLDQAAVTHWAERVQVLQHKLCQQQQDTKRLVSEFVLERKALELKHKEQLDIYREQLSELQEENNAALQQQLQECEELQHEVSVQEEVNYSLCRQVSELNRLVNESDSEICKLRQEKKELQIELGRRDERIQEHEWMEQCRNLSEPSMHERLDTTEPNVIGRERNKSAVEEARDPYFESLDAFEEAMGEELEQSWLESDSHTSREKDETSTPLYKESVAVLEALTNMMNTDDEDESGRHADVALGRLASLAGLMEGMQQDAAQEVSQTKQEEEEEEEVSVVGELPRLNESSIRDSKCYPSDEEDFLHSLTTSYIQVSELAPVDESQALENLANPVLNHIFRKMHARNELLEKERSELLCETLDLLETARQSNAMEIQAIVAEMERKSDEKVFMAEQRARQSLEELSKQFQAHNMRREGRTEGESS